MQDLWQDDPERPDDMEEVCLYDFVAEYEKCGEESDGNPVYREHTNQTTGCMIQPRKTNGRTTTTLCFSCCFPSAMKQTSSKKEKLLRVLSNCTWSIMTN